MRQVVVAVLAGVAGNILFGLLNSRLALVDGVAWWVAMIAIFGVVTAGALAVSRRNSTKKIVSGLRSGGSIDADLGEVTVRSAGDVSIGSDSQAKGGMNVKVSRIDIL
jgi:hypothetical protein